MSKEHTGLPNTPEEIRAFIGKSFSSLQFGQDNELPHENDTYTLTAHDLISAFQWSEIDAPVSAEPVAHRLLRRNGDGEWVCNEWVNGWPSTETALACMNTPELCRVQVALSNAAPVAAQPDRNPVEPTALDLSIRELDEWEASCDVYVTPSIGESIMLVLQELKRVRSAQAQPPVSGAGGLADYPTHGMNLGQRIAHVGGRENAQGYVEFGSPMAVHALIQHVLRDFHRQGRVNLVPAQQTTDPLQGAADWLVKDCGVSDPAVLANRLGIGYNRASRLLDAARKEQA